ncbi:MAG: alpha/beta hydrolase, partial [Acidimicrobiales bacterium]
PSTGPTRWQATRVQSGGATVVVACQGQGSPAVLLLNPLATTAADGWVRTPVPDALAQRTKVCVYDRPGLGQSEGSRAEPSVEAEVARLDAIVDDQLVGAPVVLVGEGYSTFAARAFAKEHLEKVAGLVLVDPPQWPITAKAPVGATPGEQAEYASLAMINDDIGRYGPAGLPPPPVPVLVIGVDASLPDRPPFPGAAVPGQPGPDGTTATTVAAEPPTRTRQQLQRELAQKAPFGKFQAVEGSGQWVQAWKPEVMVTALTKLLEDPRLER